MIVVVIYHQRLWDKRFKVKVTYIAGAMRRGRIISDQQKLRLRRREKRAIRYTNKS